MGKAGLTRPAFYFYIFFNRQQFLNLGLVKFVGNIDFQTLIKSIKRKKHRQKTQIICLINYYALHLHPTYAKLCCLVPQIRRQIK